MNFEENRLFKALVQQPFHKVARKVLELTEQGRDVSIRDPSDRTFLHVVADHADKFSDVRAVPAVYQLCLAGVEVDSVDKAGDTCLHKVAKKEGAWRILVALLRCGADPTIKDASGKTVEDILRDEGPPSWEESLHWFKKFAPGLRQIVAGGCKDANDIERLLQSWCWLRYRHQGAWISIVDDARKAGANQSNIDLLLRREDTNELAISVLAGSSKRVKKLLAAGKGDINTLDHSYQYQYQHSPQVPQPLLAAAWEQADNDLVDTLMGFQPDCNTPYYNQRDKTAKPLFFHTVNGRPVPQDQSIVYRIIRGSNLILRNTKGQTILFESTKQRMPVDFIRELLSYHVDITSRDYKGRTARDYAETRREQRYVDAIDGFVLDKIRQKDMDALEYLVVRGYEHVTDVLKNNKPNTRKLCRKLEEDRTMTEMTKFLESIHKARNRCARIFVAIDAGNLQEVQRLAQGPLVQVQNKCGHSLVHRAILSRDATVAVAIIEGYPTLVNITDNMLRTPLHYSYLLFGQGSRVSNLLMDKVADASAIDVFGRTVDSYKKETLSTHEYNVLVKDVTQFESSIFLYEMDFEPNLNEAIKAGDLQKVEELMAKAGTHADMSRYSQILFSCIDNEQPHIAEFLLRCGCDPDIWKEYEDCDPIDDACAMEQCRHPVISLQDRAKQLGFFPLAELIEMLRKAKVSVDGNGYRLPSAFESMANYGMAV